MKGDEDYFLEDLSKSTDELLSDIDGVDDLLDKMSGTTGEKIMKETQLREIAGLDLDVVPDIDGIVEVRLADNDLVALADFYPPSKEGKNIDIAEVKDKLTSMDIVFGIDWKTIQEKIDQCNNERIQSNDVIIARGIEPVHEVPEHIVIEKKPADKSMKVEDEGQSIDYKKIKSYTLVKKGQTLARIIPRRGGEFGKTVKGLFIPYKKAKVDSLKPLKNTQVENDKIVAGCDGRFMVHRNKIWVNEVFELSGDVDYSTGNITFPGDIIINGQVRDGFLVESGGSIFCKGTLDASEVKCRNNLSVDKGIIGRKRGKVRVGGMVNTKFIENCYIEAKDSIFVETGILHSIVNTLNQLEMGKKSVIVGGKIYAQNRVLATQIGTQVEVKTEIYCGIDYTVNQKLTWVKDKVNAFAMKLAMVEERIRHDPENNKKLLSVRDNLKVGLHKLNRAARALVLHLDKNEKAEVIVRDTIFPGVYIEICHVSFVVPSERKHVRIRLDRENRKIVVDKI